MSESKPNAVKRLQVRTAWTAYYESDADKVNRLILENAAPEPKYVPFEWEDREQLRGRWIVDCDGFEFMLVTMDEFAGRIGITPTQPSKRTDSTPDREPDFKD